MIHVNVLLRAQRLTFAAIKQSGRELCGLLDGSGSTFTFTMFAVSFVARLADALVRLRGVLADGVNAAVVKPLCTLVHICKKHTSLLISRVLFWPRSSTYPSITHDCARQDGRWLQNLEFIELKYFNVWSLTWVKVVDASLPPLTSQKSKYQGWKHKHTAGEVIFPLHTHTHTPSTQLQTRLSQDQNDILTSQKQLNMRL